MLQLHLLLLPGLLPYPTPPLLPLLPSYPSSPSTPPPLLPLSSPPTPTRPLLPLLSSYLLPSYLYYLPVLPYTYLQLIVSSRHSFAFFRSSGCRTATGVTKDMSSFEPVDCFLELFPKELLAYIVKETNRYGQQ